jgi:MinD-like ATPase involved in chromosome partitioning or flagellar assembly
MTVVVLASTRGSPGVTTTAVALALAWPADGARPVVVEADPDGGSAADRAGLAQDPGLATLATASRRGPGATTIADHCQELPAGVRVLVGPPSPEEMGVALGDAERLLHVLAGGPDDVVIDAGRLRPDAPTGPLVRAADTLLLVARPVLDELRATRHRVEALRGDGLEAGLVLIGDRPYPPAEVADALGAAVVGVLVDDRRAARAVWSAVPVRARRNPLVRAAGSVAAAVTGSVAAAVTGTAGGSAQ